MKKKVVVGIFAHPDDEAFGPSGTLAKFAKTKDVYLICVTDGNDVRNGISNLAQIRKRELLESANILGVKKVFFLGFKDGDLANNLYHKVASRIARILKLLRPDTLITFELRGISGHIDHIFVSMVTTYVFERLAFVKTLLYHAILKTKNASPSDYFVYFPPGYPKSEIDRVVNVAPFWEQKIRAIGAHHSQYKDAEEILTMLKKDPKEEYFLELKKKSF